MKKIKKILATKISPKTITYLVIGFLVVAFALKLYTVYFGYIYYHYIVPPGYDALPHYLNIKSMMATGEIRFSTYPPGFYFLTIALSHLFSRDVLYILTYWTPILIVLPGIAIYFLLRQLFDLKISAMVTIIFLFTSNFPLYAFVDGNYPDMLAYGFFAILLFGFLIRFLKQKRRLDLAIIGVLSVLIALTHHLSFFIVASTLIIFGIVLILSDRQIVKSVFSKKKRVILTVGMILAILCLALAFYFYGNLFLRLLGGFLTLKPAITNVFWNTPTEFTEYPYLAGAIIWYMGFAGFIYLVISTLADKKDRQIKLLLICWLVVLYILTRISFSSLPGRFARELAVPLTICLGYLLNFIFNINKLQLSRISLAIGGGLLGYLIYMNSSFFMGNNTLPNSFSDMVWFWPKDQAKVDYLSSHVGHDEPILFNPNANIWVSAKSNNRLVALELDKDQEKIVNQYLQEKNDQNRQNFERLVSDLKDKYKTDKYLFIDVKPPSNPSPITYWPYAGFEAKDAVLKSMADSGKVIQAFADGAKLFQLND